MIQIKSLESTSFDQLYEAFSAAFAEYEVQRTFEQLERMLQRRGFLPELSFGAFDEGRLVSFTCNGIGRFNGIETAYDTGTGTLKEYRGQGLAGQILQYSLPFLRKAGVKQYLLEVLKHNDAAVSVYRKQGFEVVREFSYFTAERAGILTKKWINIPDITITTTDLNTVKNLSSWFDFEPSWQNSFESVGRQTESFVIKTAYIDNSPVAYCIFEPESGDITQIVVKPECRRKGIATALLSETLNECKSSGVKLINTDNQFQGINCWAESVNLTKRGEQFEMILRL
jgi:ribosomal protein S18 acetylase RimI-like enzyme